jgi:hypothetical protein
MEQIFSETPAPNFGVFEFANGAIICKFGHSSMGQPPPLPNNLFIKIAVCS